MSFGTVVFVRWEGHGELTKTCPCPLGETSLGLPVVPFSPLFFGWEGFPTKIDNKKDGYPYSNLSNLEELDETSSLPEKGTGGFFFWLSSGPPRDPIQRVDWTSGKFFEVSS